MTAASNNPSPVQREKRWQWLVIGGFVTILASVAFALWLAFLPKEKVETNVVTAAVERGSLLKTVAATAKVVPNFEVEIKAKASGKIIRLPYDVSDIVHQGDLLVQLDPIDESRNVSQSAASLVGLESRAEQSRVNLDVARRTLATDLAKARADLSAAQARNQDAQTKAKRLATLVQQRYISQQEYETGITAAAQAKTDLQNAQTRLKELQTQQLALQAQAEDVEFSAAQARAQRVALASSQQRLAETRIYAPISGVVTARAGQIGQIVSSGISNVGGGTAIMMLADLSHIYVLASVDESDIGQVREGQAARITADAYPGEQFQGTVVRIAPKGFVESNVVTFEVKIEVTSGNNHLLKPEMTTNVEIVTAQKQSILKIPADAVATGRDGGRFVLVQKEKSDKPERRPVITGLDNGTEVEIVKGLAMGEAIVVNRGQTRSRWRKDGQPGNSSGPNNNRRGQMMMMRSFGRR
jgi:HlyD family secretion protein